MNLGFNVIRSNWLRRRWLDFRNGHSIYLVFLMTFANFVTIQYSLLLDRIPEFKALFGNVAVFAAIFIAIYFPLSMIIGYWHRKSQWKVEAEAMFKENVIGAKIWLFAIDLIDGRASEEEKKNMREMLLKIINRKDIVKNVNTVAGKNDLLTDVKLKEGHEF